MRCLRKGLKELEGNLVKRGFKKNLIDEEFFKAKAKRREDLFFQNIRSKAKENSKRIPLVVNFQPALSGIGSDFHCSLVFVKHERIMEITRP